MIWGLSRIVVEPMAWMLRLDCCPLVRNHSRFQVAPVMDRYHKSYQELNGTESQRKPRTKVWLRSRAKIDTQVFFRELFSVDPVGQISWNFPANFDVEDWKMTLEELRLGYSNLWDQTWNFSNRSVETGKLQHSHSAVSLFSSIFSTPSLAASCFSQHRR